MDERENPVEWFEQNARKVSGSQDFVNIMFNAWECGTYGCAFFMLISFKVVDKEGATAYVGS